MMSETGGGGVDKQEHPDYEEEGCVVLWHGERCRRVQRMDGGYLTVLPLLHYNIEHLCGRLMSIL